FHASPHPPLAERPEIRLWTGLDLSCRTRGVAVLYTRWFYVMRQAIPGDCAATGRSVGEDGDVVGRPLGLAGSTVPTARVIPVAGAGRWSRIALSGGLATLKGRVAMFNPQKTFFAYSDPALAGSLAVLRSRAKTYMGVRVSMVQTVYDRSPNERDLFEFHGVA